MKVLTFTVVLVIESICISGAHNIFRKRTHINAQKRSKAVQREHRIVGGTPAKVGAYPYFVDLMDGCGASLIAPGVVLSAAHCQPSGFSYIGQSVIIGSYDRAQLTNNAVQATVTESLPHPNYNVPVSLANDFLLLKLDSPVVASGSITFSLNSVNSTPAAGEKLTVFGTGFTEENGFLSDILLEVDVPTTSIDSCNVPYDGGVDGETMLCAGGKGKDSCQGDSGGPIIVKKGNTHTQVGVTSWGIGCGLPGVPGVYARVSAAMNWIAYVTCTCWGVNDANICSNLNPDDNFSCESPSAYGSGSSGCEIISSWADEYGDGCGWFEQNDIEGCPLYGFIEDSNGVSAWQACCHCEGGDPSAGSDEPGCELVPGWVDSIGDKCGWYEVNDSPGCPIFGHIEDVNLVKASQACCHCQGGGNNTNDVGQAGCELVAGWIDLAGDTCAWYESNDSLGCPNYGNYSSFDGTTAWEACCHCKGGGNDVNSNDQTGCQSLGGWVDTSNDTCEWYENNESPGCPNYGFFTSVSGVTAWEACCHCKGSGNNADNNSDGQTGCELIAGWMDLAGDTCAWYESNDSPGCPDNGNITSIDGVTAWDACCHCKEGGNDTNDNGNGQTGCESLIGWVDTTNDTCEWYESNDFPGCPNYGSFTSGSGVTAWEACCHCKGGDNNTDNNSDGQTGCELVAGWIDFAGDTCAWFESNDSPGCPTYGLLTSVSGVTALEACCHCQGDGNNIDNNSDGQTGCELVAGWIDFVGDTCAWYESNDSPGCPNNGNITSIDEVTAWEACCHCKEGGNDTNDNNKDPPFNSDIDEGGTFNNNTDDNDTTVIPSFGLCFSGENYVKTFHKGWIPMKTVSIGDKVLVGADKEIYDIVYSFGHLNHDETVKYLSIKTSAKGENPLEITPNHMVLMNDGYYLPASKIRVGDEIMTTSSSSNHQKNDGKVINISSVYRKGMYAPFTLTGNIVVNNIIASNYISYYNYNNDDKSNTKEVLKRILSLQHWMAHAYNSVHRITYRLGFFTINESYTADGISIWVAKAHTLIVWLLKKHQDGNIITTLMMILLFMMVFPVIIITLAMLTIIEKILLRPLLLCTWFLFYAVVVARKINNKKKIA